MAWISFAIIVLIFYAPCFGLGKQIAEQQFQLPISALPNPIPFGGHLLLFLYTLALWGVLWLLLWLLETSGIFAFLRKDALRNGFLYSLLPRLSNGIAVFLADIIFARWALASLLEVLSILLSRITIGAAIFQSISSFLTGVVDFLGALPIPAAPEIIVLSALTIIVARAFQWEQQLRNEEEIHQQLIRRKQRLFEMNIQETR